MIYPQSSAVLLAGNTKKSNVGPISMGNMIIDGGSKNFHKFRAFVHLFHPAATHERS